MNEWKLGQPLKRSSTPPLNLLTSKIKNLGFSGRGSWFWGFRIFYFDPRLLSFSSWALWSWIASLVSCSLCFRLLCYGSYVLGFLRSWVLVLGGSWVLRFSGGVLVGVQNQWNNSSQISLTTNAKIPIVYIFLINQYQSISLHF